MSKSNLTPVYTYYNVHLNTIANIFEETYLLEKKTFRCMSIYIYNLSLTVFNNTKKKEYLIYF